MIKKICEIKSKYLVAKNANITVRTRLLGSIKNLLDPKIEQVVLTLKTRYGRMDEFTKSNSKPAMKPFNPNIKSSIYNKSRRAKNSNCNGLLMIKELYSTKCQLSLQTHCHVQYNVTQWFRSYLSVRLSRYKM